MSTLPAWAAPYVGLRFADHGRGPDAFDCWGLARWIQRRVFGIELPDYGDMYRIGAADPRAHAAVRADIASAIPRVAGDGWQCVDDPREGDLIVLNIAARPLHIGVVLAPPAFLHVRENSDSVVESWDGPLWRNRIEGFYRFAGAAHA